MPARPGSSPIPGWGAYAITKHGLCALTRLVAEENQASDQGVGDLPGRWTTMTDDVPQPARRRFLRVADVVGFVDGLLLQDANVKMGPEILMRTMRNPWE